MNIAYFDCFSGISGDMILGAFLDLGLPQKLLRQTLSQIPLPELRLTGKTGRTFPHHRIFTASTREKRETYCPNL